VPRSPLLAFTINGHDPRALASALDEHGVEARAGCHCATLAHLDLGLTPPATCRLSFAAYTSEGDVDRAVDALARVVATRRS
jgi:cysteine desulfurase/selenocysteine lyase